MNSGIYKITNNVTGLSYIGSSKRIRRRWTEHRTALRRNQHYNKHLQSAWQKYGERAFNFEVCCNGEPDDLKDLERVWFELIPQSLRYNLEREPGKPWLGRRHSEATIAKLCEIAKRPRNLTPEGRARIIESNRTREVSAEARRKISDALRRRVPSDETRRRLSAATSAHYKQIKTTI